ncbi:MAG: GNAT family N-acetyltransferase [Chitinophagaceae bacterium]|nr:GNAT family N-acetyltransferase [Chitinophagaceae bacterium]
MLDISIRRATEFDTEELSIMISDNAKALLSSYYSDVQMAVFLRHYAPEAIKSRLSKTVLFVAETKGEILGSIGLDDDLVVGFYTKANHTGKGIGTKLLKHLENYATENGFVRIELSASPIGEGFYLKQGWRKVEDTIVYYYDTAFNEALMEKIL